VGLLAGSFVLVAVVGCWFLMRGAPSLSFSAMVHAVFGGGSGDGPYLVRQVRLPRLILGLASGAALGLAGTLLQYSLRNPIADPSLLGVSQAASFVVALSVLFPAALPAAALPFACLAAGIFTSVLLVVLARSIRNPVQLILVGVVLASLGATLTSATVILLPTARTIGLSQFFGYTAGTIANGSWDRVDVLLPWLAVGIPGALLSGRALNLLQLGDDMAIGRGMRVTRTRVLLLTCAAILVAPVVAVIGPLSFVALLSPHVARAVLGTSNAHLVLPASAAVGAVVVLLADTAGRLLLFPTEIPAGIWTIVVIGPAAIWMARRTARRSAPVEA
jgi:iron complex transport system permease protein